MDARTPDGQGPRTETAELQARHDGQVVVTAAVQSSPEPHGTAQVALQRHRDDAPAEVRSELVDRVLEVPGVSNSDEVHVVLPLGDSASITRLQERTTGFRARAAGSSSIIDANLPHEADGDDSGDPLQP